MKDPSFNEPVIDPDTGEEETFTGWRDPNYKPEPGATPYPACYLNALTGGGGSSAPPASIDPSAPVVTVGAASGAATTGFDPDALEVSADTAFTLEFDNQDATAPHNIVIKDPGGTNVSIGDTAPFTGPKKVSYAVPALAAGAYPFVCEVHLTTMTGTLTVQ